MRVLERLFCNYMWLAWAGLLVSRRGARPEERPTFGQSCQGGDACPSNEPGPATPDLSASPGAHTGKRTR